MHQYRSKDVNNRICGWLKSISALAFGVIDDQAESLDVIRVIDVFVANLKRNKSLDGS